MKAQRYSTLNDGRPPLNKKAILWIGPFFIIFFTLTYCFTSMSNIRNGMYDKRVLNTLVQEAIKDFVNDTEYEVENLLVANYTNITQNQIKIEPIVLRNMINEIVTNSLNTTKLRTQKLAQRIMNKYVRNCSTEPSISQSLVNMTQNTLVPNIIHMVYFFPPGIIDIPYWVLLNVIKAVKVQKPDKLLFHIGGATELYLKQFGGKNYQRLIKIKEFKFIEERNITEIFGRPIKSLAHKADVIRLEALSKYGGIYLDTDIILFKPVTNLMNNEMVMAMEKDNALANGFMIAKPNCTFINIWYDKYKTFDDNKWGDHSVLLPRKLADEYPTKIVLLTMKSFYIPYFNEIDTILFNPKNVVRNLEESRYGIHLWHKLAEYHLSQITSPEYFCTGKMVSTYSEAIISIVREIGDCPNL